MLMSRNDFRTTALFETTSSEQFDGRGDLKSKVMVRL